ncbi:MAG: hypothetical protein MJ252_14680 [archaeon]|nr:hypothetical protein [archaeon]
MAYPFFLLFFGIYLIIKVYSAAMFQNDLKLATLFYSFTKYMFSFILLNIPNFFIMFLSTFIIGNIQDIKWLRWTIQLTSLLSCAIPLILSIQRAVQGLVRVGWVEKLRKKVREKLYGEGNENEGRTHLISKDEYEWIESYVMKYFMRDIFIGISYCIDFGGRNFRSDLKLTSRLGPQNLEFVLRTIKLKKDYKLDDTIDTSEDEEYEVKIIEYSPFIFYIIRQREGIVFEDMVRSFLPKFNVQGIKEGQGKSGAFFISTDDNQYIIKTLKAEELELIRYSFLEKYSREFLKGDQQKDSILCPIYGIFKVLTNGGGDCTFFVMRNLFGNFKDNITCKYDLKGSTLGRKQDIENEVLEKTVMKDLNFEEIERALLISKEDQQRLISACENDSKFLADMGLMDYSLLVVKLSLSKSEIDHIFNGAPLIQEEDEKDTSMIMGRGVSSAYQAPVNLNTSQISGQEFNTSQIYESGLDTSQIGKRGMNTSYNAGAGQPMPLNFFREALKANAEKRNQGFSGNRPASPKKPEPKKVQPSKPDVKRAEVKKVINQELGNMPLIPKMNLSPNISVDETQIKKDLSEVDHIKYYKRYLYRSLQEGQAYIVSIIDYLTIYNFFKVVETNYKFVVQCKGTNVQSLSCVDPKTYSERFIKFVKKISNADRALKSDYASTYGDPNKKKTDDFK